MFEVNGVYANRKGEYTVLELAPPLMRVRYTDGTEAELKISVQERIWENIFVEYEAKAASKSARRSKTVQGTNHYIKVVGIPAIEELAFPGWPERLVLAPSPDQEIMLKAGDRLIFFGLESRTFFAVATITSEASTANPKDYFFTISQEEASFFPIDIDAAVLRPDAGVDVDTIELESQPRFKRLRLEGESYLAINEDDFELLAEAVTELTEEEELEEDELDDDFDEDDVD